MGLPADVLPLLATPIQIERFQSRDGSGNPTFAAAITVGSRIETRQRRRSAPQGRENVIGRTESETVTRIIVDFGNYTVYDRVTLPGGNQPTVLTVDTEYGLAGDPWYQTIYSEENRQ